MSNNASSGAPGGIGFAGALTLLFIGLKLGHVIKWPWLWVLSPMWISAALVLAIVVLVLLGAFIGVSVKERRATRQRVTRR